MSLQRSLIAHDHRPILDRLPSRIRFATGTIKNWERYGLKSWIEAAKRRLHHNVLAIALANKLARIAWAVLAKGRAFELTRTDDAGVRPA
jgi:hypothetical protein